MFYFLKSKLADQVLDLKGSNPRPGTPVIAFPKNGPDGTDNQKWEFVYSGTLPFFFIRSKLAPEEVLAVDGSRPGAPVVISSTQGSGSPGQLWVLVPNGGGYFYIKSRLTGEVMDVQGANETPGKSIIAQPRTPGGSPNQLWQLIPASQ